MSATRRAARSSSARDCVATVLGAAHPAGVPLGSRADALANVMKRAVVITVAIVYAARPVSPLHMFGVALSVFGTILYQKLDEAGRDSSRCDYVPIRTMAESVELAEVPNGDHFVDGPHTSSRPPR